MSLSIMFKRMVSCVVVMAGLIMTLGADLAPRVSSPCLPSPRLTPPLCPTLRTSLYRPITALSAHVTRELGAGEGEA